MLFRLTVVALLRSTVLLSWLRYYKLRYGTFRDLIYLMQNMKP